MIMRNNIPIQDIVTKQHLTEWLRTRSCSHLGLKPGSALLPVTLDSPWTLSDRCPEGRREHQIDPYCETSGTLPLPQGYHVKAITCPPASRKNIFLHTDEHQRDSWHQNMLVLEVLNGYPMVRNSLTVTSVSRHCSGSIESQKGPET